MAIKSFACSAILIVLVILSESSAQFWRQSGYHQRYPQQNYPTFQQRSYQQQGGYQLPPGVSVSDAEWVCKNPKTGDMMIIASEDVPSNGQGQWQPPNNGGNGQGQWQPPNNGGNGQGQWQPPTFPQPPNYPQVNPNYPTTQRPTSTWPTYPTQKPNHPNQGPTNSNGDGLIDIRFGE